VLTSKVREWVAEHGQDALDLVLEGAILALVCLLTIDLVGVFYGQGGLSTLLMAVLHLISIGGSPFPQT
jgi:hypothetical protein